MDDLITNPLDLARLQTVLERFGLGAGRADRAVLDDAAVVQIVAAEPAAPPLDLRAFRELIGGDPDFARDIAQTFLHTSEEILAQLARSAERGDRKSLARAAHSLKGASANVHAQPLRELCADLESRSESATDRELPELVARVAAEQRRVAAALHQVSSEAHRPTGSL
ncbi:MAG: Hpt domain-containing protein [Steroidobacteraceae bacterium]